MFNSLFPICQQGAVQDGNKAFILHLWPDRRKGCAMFSLVGRAHEKIVPRLFDIEE